MTPIKTRRQRYSIIENIFRILEQCLRPTLKTHVRDMLKATWSHFQALISLLLDKKLLTYVTIDKSRGKIKRYEEALITTDEGKKLLEQWKIIAKVLTGDDDFDIY